jgi:hypothetical protein
LGPHGGALPSLKLSKRTNCPLELVPETANESMPTTTAALVVDQKAPTKQTSEAMLSVRI